MQANLLFLRGLSLKNIARIKGGNVTSTLLST